MADKFDVEIVNDDNINDIEIIDNAENIEINAEETEQNIDVEIIDDDEIEIDFKDNTEEIEIDFGENTGGIAKETDPTVPEHVKKITEEDINKWNNPDIPEVDNNYNNATNKPSINGTELVGNLSTEQLKLIYEKLLNLPKINGVELIGNKTTEDLGIEASGGTNINIIDTFDYLKRFQNNDIYNANAVNSSVDWIIQAILEAFNREVLVDINVVVNPQTFEVISNDSSYSDVVNALDLGGTTRVICQLAGTNIRVVLQLSMDDGTCAYFTTVMKANLGYGEMKYLLGINISERYTKVIVEPLQ